MAMSQGSGWSTSAFVLGAVSLLIASPAFGQPYGLDSRAPINAFLNSQLPPAEQGSGGGWRAVEAFPNLTFDDPVKLVPDPGANRLFVCGRQGTIHFITNMPSTTTRTLFLDLTAVTQGYDDCGLIGLVFHPEFGVAGSTNRGHFFVYYQYSPSPVVPSGGGRPPSATPGYNRLSRFTVPEGWFTGNQNAADIRATEVILINQYDRHVWHNGGDMFFGDDGFLYVSNGDEGAANDSYNQTQKINSGLFSGVLRIDVNRDPAKSHPIRRQPVHVQAPPAGWPGTFSQHYYVPNDNPWLDPGGSVLEEFWAVGLRSPHRMTLDPVTKKVWLGDIGQGTREEVDIIEKGGNYQWAYREGGIAGPKAKPSPLIGVDKPPVYDYGRGAGDTCVIGGYVYRGAQFPELYGKYIFGDNTSGRVWSMTYDGVNPTTVVELFDTGWPGNYLGLSSFGVDHNHELYVLKMGRSGNKGVYKLARTADQPPPPPSRLSQTGAFTDLTTLTPSPGIIPFTVNSPLWSDAAVKFRWIAVPNDGAPYGATETLGFSSAGEWTFPNGTVFIKHFELPVDDTNPNIRKRLETRFLIRGTNGAAFGFTYKWRADNSDADLLPDSLNEDVLISTGSGTRTQTWFYPGRQDCLTCHNANAGHVLGVKTRQLNGDFFYPSTGRTDNQLRTWNHVGLFSPAINEANIPSYAKTVPVTDSGATLEHRSRSYLDANCAQCHRPNGAAALFDARFDTPLDQQGLVNGPVVDPLGINGAKVVAPQSLAQSVLYQRDNSLASIKMPPLAKNRIDSEAMPVLAAWINSLPPEPVLPYPWAHQDIGGVNLAGDANYSSGTFTLTASGTDIWNTADGFHFVHQTLNANGEIIARVASVQNTDPWAKAGVMIRENLSAGSRHAFMCITPGNGAAFQRRLSPGGVSTHTAGPLVAAPRWVRLVRNGTTFTGYQSSDGINWQVVGSDTVVMDGPVYVGLAVTAHNNSVLNGSTFTGVEAVVPNTPPTISAVGNQTTDEDTPAGPISFSVNDPEQSPDSLLVTASSSNTGLVPNASLVLGGSGPGRSVSATPAANQFGSTTVTLAVSDGITNTSTSFVLTVNSVNDLPTISNISDRTIDEDTSTGPVAFTVGDVETTPASLTLSRTSSNPALIPAGNITFGGSGASRSVTLTPVADQSGTATITITVGDGADTVSEDFLLTVNAVNDPPTISDISDQVTTAGMPVGPLAFSVSDIDNPAGDLTLSASPSNPTLLPEANIAFGGSGPNRTITVTPAPNRSGNTLVSVTVSDGTVEANDAFDLDVFAGVVARHVFYNDSFFDGEDPDANAADDAAIATDKVALRPGQAATFANYTSYSRGINGVMVDIAGLAGTPTTNDFAFHVGNNSDPAGWSNAPAPSSIAVRAGAGAGGADRITLLWPESAIAKQWLQITVNATPITGLESPDVFYFGNAIGDSGNSLTDAKVNATDEINARNNARSAGQAAVDFQYDYNRDGRVNATDEILARNNATSSLTALQLISSPPASFSATMSEGFTQTLVKQPRMISVSSGSDGTLRIRFTGLPAGTYRIQSLADLNTGIWTDLVPQPEVVPTNGVLEFTDTGASDRTARFYRILVK